MNVNKIGTNPFIGDKIPISQRRTAMSAAAEQLCLLDMNVAPEPPTEVDLVESVLSACGGDARLAIREFLADADFLRDQLYIASELMSKGMSRGWRPKYERV
jgi:hypothetical protein